ncbi:MAG: hypothetical protein DCC67_06255 [Planctomycetota bacterium]|nr:MAG: hypothetical protein DCC67_06255 [Planctomycetota bacterium]
MSSNGRHVVRREPAAVPARCSVHAAALVLALACPGAAQAASGGDFPYIAYVAAPKATMRSGPGHDH